MTAFVGEIRMFGGSFAPAGWAFCDGATMPISENEVLFQLIGTTYGGDGESTFVLPDLRGRIPVHRGTNQIATTYGAETVTLTVQQIPVHTHGVGVSNSVGYVSEPAKAVPAADRDFAVFDTTPSAGTPMATPSVEFQGGNQPHDNMPPYLCISFIISLFGIFPTQS